MRVTVLLATYNGEKFIDEQLQSIKEQSDVNVKVLVRDDGSTDSTLSILERWKKVETTSDFSLEYYCGSNVGAARSFIELINDVSEESDFYAFSDQDDSWLPEKLSIAIQKLNEFDQDIPSLYYGDTTRVGEQLEEISNPFGPRYHTEEIKKSIISTAAGGLTMVFNKSLLRILKEYSPCYLTMHDRWTLLVCASVGGKVFYDSKSYVLYRQHGSNVLGGQNKMKLSGCRLFFYRIKKMFNFVDKPSRYAEELLKGFSEYINSENMKVLQDFSEGRTLKGRLRLLANMGYRTGYFAIDVKFALQVFLGQV